MSNQKTCAIYVRTSTADKQNPDGQESELRALVEKRGWKSFQSIPGPRLLRCEGDPTSIRRDVDGL